MFEEKLLVLFLHVSNKIMHNYTIKPYKLEIMSIEFQLKVICSQKTPRIFNIFVEVGFYN